MPMCIWGGIFIMIQVVKYNKIAVAIKIISNNLIKSDYTSQQIKREVEIMKSFNH